MAFIFLTFVNAIFITFALKEIETKMAERINVLDIVEELEHQDEIEMEKDIIEDIEKEFGVKIEHLDLENE